MPAQRYELQDLLRLREMREDERLKELDTARATLAEAERRLAEAERALEEFRADKPATIDALYAAVLRQVVAQERLERLRQAVAELDAAELTLAREAETLARDAREKEAEIELYARERGQAMRELEEKKRAEIMAEILKEVENRAVAEGYDFVLDSSGKTMNDQPSLLRFPRKDDLTGAVIKKLNSTRTPGAAAPPAAAESVNPKP